MARRRAAGQESVPASFGRDEGKDGTRGGGGMGEEFIAVRGCLSVLIFLVPGVGCAYC